MPGSHRRHRLAVILCLIPLFLTACFRDTSEVIEQQPVARQLATATAEQPAEPTAEPPTATEESQPTQQPADDFALSATAIIARQTEAPAQEASNAQGTAVPAVQATPIPVARATIPPGEDCVHEIRAGDTLFQLSLAYGVTVDQIASASDISNPDQIAVGQQITIPVCGSTGFIPPPTSFPTATIDPNALAPTNEPAELEIAAVEDDSRSELIVQAQESLLNNAQVDVAGDFSIQNASLPTPSRTYTMQDNDTLLEVAILYNTTVEIIAALNNITDVDNVAAGTVLQIP